MTIIKFENVIRWRYLDCLDSIRYSKEDLLIRPVTKTKQVIQAEMEMGATILMGNGIIFPANQLIDSVGFLNNAFEMIKAYQYYSSKGKDVFFPLKYAFYDYGHEPEIGGGPHLINPFLLAAHLFKKDGLEGRQPFELSAWPNLEPSRRQEWVKLLENHIERVPVLNTVDADDEPNLARNLIQILRFFNDNRNLIKSVPSNTGDRQEMIRYFSTLSKEQIENDTYLLNILRKNNLQAQQNRLVKLDNIVKVFSKLEEKTVIIGGKPKNIIDNRSEIRKELREKENEYFEGSLDDKKDQRMGVFAIVDSIYNFCSFRSTFAKQDSQTEPMKNDLEWGYDELAFALGRWAREKYVKAHSGGNNDLYTRMDSYVYPLPGDLGWTLGNFDEFWNNFFDFQSSDDWSDSLLNYMNQLALFENEKYKFDVQPKGERTAENLKKLLDKSKLYEEARKSHIACVNKYLDKKKFKIEIDEGNEKTELLHRVNGEIISRIQIEDFGENPLLSKQEKIILHAELSAIGITSKGETTEFER